MGAVGKGHRPDLREPTVRGQVREVNTAGRVNAYSREHRYKAVNLGWCGREVREGFKQEGSDLWEERLEQRPNQLWWWMWGLGAQRGLSQMMGRKCSWV